MIPTDFSAAAFSCELDQILGWWQRRMIDRENGGFYGRIDGHGQLHPTADKGVILHTRLLWTFASAARVTESAAYAESAHRAYRYLRTYFFDPAAGGLFWLLDFRGHPVQTRKQVYAQAFGIYALSAYYAWTRDPTALDRARSLLNLLTQHSRDTRYGGYREAFDRDWRPIADQRLSEKDLNAARTMNTHLHVLEALTALHRVAPAPETEVLLAEAILLFLDYFIDPVTGHLRLFFSEQWQSQSAIISYGHDIECSWLLSEATTVLGDSRLTEQLRPVCLRLAAAVFARGLAREHTAVLNERRGNHLDTDRHWWPQAEAVVGFWNAYELSGTLHYAEAAKKCWQYIMRYVKDPADGEWHWRLDERERPVQTEDKAGPWKAPYHNGRMCLEMMRRLQQPPPE